MLSGLGATALALWAASVPHLSLGGQAGVSWPRSADPDPYRVTAVGMLAGGSVALALPHGLAFRSEASFTTKPLFYYVSYPEPLTLKYISIPVMLRGHYWASPRVGILVGGGGSVELLLKKEEGYRLGLRFGRNDFCVVAVAGISVRVGKTRAVSLEARRTWGQREIAPVGKISAWQLVASY